VRPPFLRLLLLICGLSFSVAPLAPGHTAAQALPSGRLSFLHLSADAAALDVYVDGGRAVQALNFGETSEYLGLSPGGHRVQITPSGRLDVLLNETATVQAGASATWVLSGLIAAADVAITLTPDLQFARHLELSDNAGAAGDNRPRLRIVNASPGSGTFDVRTTAPTAATLATALAYGNISAYTTLAPDTYTVAIYTAGGQTPIASIGALALQAANAYTLVLGGLLPGVVAAAPANPLQPFTSVRLTDQNSLRAAALTRGCNQVVLNLPVGSPIVGLLARMADPTLVSSIWRFDNVAKTLRVGYFSEPTAPLDFTATLGSPEAAFICVSANTTWNPPI